jgi:hypothetical protein
MKRKLLLTATLAVTLALPASARAGTLGTDVIGMFPQNVGEFAYADLRQARSLSWFPQLEDQMLPPRFRQFEQFLAAAGVDPNSQVEELAWALVPTGLPTGPAAKTAVPTGDQVVGIALGSFQPETAEAYFRAQKLPVVKVRDYSLYAFGSGSGPQDLFFLFIDANTAAFGQRQELEKLIAVRYGEQQGLLDNPELSPLITEANGSGVVWAVLNAPYTRLAMRQLAPETAQFPQAEQLASKLRALIIEIQADSGVQAHFQAVCNSPDDANTFAALLQAGLLYRRYQIGNSNPDLASMLDQARIAPSGDRLDIRLTLTDDQIIALIWRNTFVMHM